MASQYTTDHAQPIWQWEQLRDAIIAGFCAKSVESYGGPDHSGIDDPDTERVPTKTAVLTDAQCLAIFDGLMCTSLCPKVELLKVYEREVQKTISSIGANRNETELGEVARKRRVVGQAKAHILLVSDD